MVGYNTASHYRSMETSLRQQTNKTSYWILYIGKLCRNKKINKKHGTIATWKTCQTAWVKKPTNTKGVTNNNQNTKFVSYRTTHATISIKYNSLEINSRSLINEFTGCVYRIEKKTAFHWKFSLSLRVTISLLVHFINFHSFSEI